LTLETMKLADGMPVPPLIVHCPLVMAFGVEDRVHVLSANENPCPLTVTVTPVLPLPGAKVIVGPVTMKEPSTKSEVTAVMVLVTVTVTELPPPTETLTLYAPGP